jgi:uncharacterized protein (TIGR00266 family)
MVTKLDYQIFGDDLQLVQVELEPGEGVRAETGTMTFMETGIDMQTTTGGGLMAGLKRVLTGESFFVTTFLNQSQQRSHVAFAAPHPGKIIPIHLEDFAGSFICQRDSFLCADQDIQIEIAFSKRLGAGIFGGEGFILQRLTGSGLAFVHACGTIIEKDLAPGEMLRVDTGCLVAFATTVDYDIQFVGGFQNALFGGEGLFLAKMTGPGKLYLQSLPFSRLADRIITASRRTSVEEKKGVAGIGGDILGNLLSGDR